MLKKKRVTRRQKQYGPAIRQCIVHYGAGAINVLIDMMRARVSYNVGGSIFCFFSMHERPASNWREYRDYYNGHIQVLRIVNETPKRATDMRDKMAFATELKAAGVAMAPIAAIAGGRCPPTPWCPVLSSRAAVTEFVEGPSMPASAFIKPSDGAKGEGAFKATRSGAGWAVLQTLLSSAELADRIWLDGGCNLIQPILRTHSELADLGGEYGMSTVRIITARTEAGPELVGALFKLLQKPSTVDNFVGGANGVLLAPIDLETGRLRAAVGFHPTRYLIQERHDRHPRLGGLITGRQVPLFEEAAALAKDVSNALPSRRMIGMDIALTDTGAHLLDVNLAWGCMLPQIAFGRGIGEVYREWVPRLDLDPEKRRAALQQFDRF